MARLLPLIPLRDTHMSLQARGGRCAQRYAMDANFSRRETRIFCISDVHIDQHGNLGWFKTLSNQNFQNDVLLIAGESPHSISEITNTMQLPVHSLTSSTLPCAGLGDTWQSFSHSTNSRAHSPKKGDIGDTMNAVQICLKEFRKRFRRVFLIPGNHDLWIRKDTNDAKVYPDSIAKLGAMHNVARDCGCDLGPAEVSHEDRSSGRMKRENVSESERIKRRMIEREEMNRFGWADFWFSLNLFLRMTLL